LPFTYFENYKAPQIIDKLFWGRSDLVYTYALLYFKKGSKTQTLMHHLKYKNKADLGIQLGEMIGNRLMNDGENKIDFLVPVPLHPRKQFKRGYNQSERLAKGLSNKWGIPINDKTLIRGSNAQSQTKKGRYGRWTNVSEAFLIKDFKTLENKHVALIDDVITTGATLESCVQLLQSKVKGIRVSIICLAVTV
jgi:ComF family protein